MTPQDLVDQWGWWLVPAMYALSFTIFFVIEFLDSFSKNYKFSFKTIFECGVLHATICVIVFLFVIFMRSQYVDQPEPPPIERIYFEEE